MKTVSIVIPVYNMASYLRYAIDSVLQDDYPHKEIIVVDDGSTDDSLLVAESYGDAIKLIKQDNSGAAVALNNGFKVSSGDYLCWLSADDLFIAGKISAQLHELEARPEIAATYTGAEVINQFGNFLYSAIGTNYDNRYALYRLMLGNDINGSTMMLRRSVFFEMGCFRETQRADVDGAMWMEILGSGHRISRVLGVYGKYRVHASNQSHDRKLMDECMDKTRFDIISKYWVYFNQLFSEDKSKCYILLLSLKLQRCTKSSDLVLRSCMMTLPLWMRCCSFLLNQDYFFLSRIIRKIAIMMVNRSKKSLYSN
jgi:glycosyltransferase involved in cell wall biosynthesis